MVSAHNSESRGLGASPGQACCVVFLGRTHKAVFTLGARALVPGHRYKMVLCSDTRYLIC